MDLGLERYLRGDGFDEFVGPDGQPRPAARALCNYLTGLAEEDLLARRAAVDAAIVTMGITFTTYGDGASIDRAWPFDPIPRVMPASEWERIDRGLRQRLTALNLFIDDLYNEQKIVRDGVFPAELLANSRNFRVQCKGMSPRFGVWAHICRHRSGARQGRHGVRARGQPQGSLGRLVHAREPHIDEVGLPGAVRDVPDPARGRLHRGALRHAGGTGARARETGP